jgi:hypothetical protein
MDYFSVLGSQPNQDEFSFVFTDKTVKVSQFVANILSPKISHLHRQDPSFKSFDLNFEYNHNSFNKILSLAYGKKIKILNKEIKFFYDVFLAFENHKFLDQFLPDFNQKITQENVLMRVNFKDIIGLDPSEELSFIAPHITKYEIELIPIKYIIKIFSMDTLEKVDQNMLFEGVSTLIYYFGTPALPLLYSLKISELNAENRKKYFSYIKPKDGISPILLNSIKEAFKNDK